MRKWSVPWVRPRYTVGVKIKSEMILLSNAEEVASSKTYAPFKTREHIPYPISDQNGQNWPKLLKNRQRSVKQFEASASSTRFGLRHARLKVVVLQPTVVSDLGASFSRLGCFVLRFKVLRFRNYRYRVPQKEVGTPQKEVVIFSL